MTNEAIVITGKENIQLARLLTLRHGLKLEMKGLKMSRGMSCGAIVKREFGWKGSKTKLLSQLTAYMNEIHAKMGIELLKD